LFNIHHGSHLLSYTIDGRPCQCDSFFLKKIKNPQRLLPSHCGFFEFIY